MLDDDILIVDKLEADLTVCEAQGMLIELAPADLAAPARPGDILRRREDGRYYVDEAATQARAAALRSRFERLKK